MSDIDLDFVTYDDVEVGETGTTRGRTITAADITQYSGVVGGDYHPVHTNLEVAEAEMGSRARTASASLLFSFAYHLVIDHCPAITYGFDSVRFLAPVKVGETIFAEWEITDKENWSDDYGQFTMDVDVHNQDGKTVAGFDLIKIADREEP